MEYWLGVAGLVLVLVVQVLREVVSELVLEVEVAAY